MSSNFGLRVWRAGAPGRLAARAAVLGLVLGAVLLTPAASTPMPPSMPLLAALAGASIVGSAMAALLLLFQARALGSTAMTALGAGFAFVSASLVPYLVSYPAMFGPPEAPPATSAVLWVASQLALVAALVLYVRFRRCETAGAGASRWGTIVVAAFAAAFVAVFGIALDAGIVPGYADGSPSAIVLRIAAPLAGSPALAVAFAALRLRNPTYLDIGVAIVAVVAVLDLYLTAIGLHPFSLGWYVARVQLLLATIAILGILFAQAARLYAELVARARLLADEAYTDTLTGLPNRRRFDEELARASGSTMRRGGDFSVAMIDIDRFKRYNDEFGHQAGDVALRRIGNAIASSAARSGDFAARYGGEEFVVILEDTGLDGAFAVAERIRNEVLRVGIPTRNDRTMSVSVGIATRRPGEPVDALLRRADQALYAAKNAGRNRVMSSTTERAVGS